MFGGQRMTAVSRIVAGGGWKDVRIERVRVKAWTALFGAIGLASIAMQTGESFRVFAFILAALGFLTSVVFFVRERPRELQFSWGRGDHDLRNLYGAAGKTQPKADAGSAEPCAPPNDGPATPVGNSGAAKSVS